jgi:predicted transcriptional regulator
MEQKRYNLVLPAEVFDEVKTIADSRNTTVKQLLHRFIKLGLIAIKIDETPGAALIIREGDSEREIVFY